MQAETTIQIKRKTYKPLLELQTKQKKVRVKHATEAIRQVAEIEGVSPSRCAAIAVKQLEYMTDRQSGLEAGAVVDGDSGSSVNGQLSESGFGAG